MSYVDKVLGEDEQVLYRTTLHWVVYFWPAVTLIIALLLAPRLNTFLVSGSAGFIPATLALGWLGIVYLHQRFEEHVVTNRRAISRLGIFRRDVFIYPLESIQTIEVRQGVIARMIGYGSVETHTSTESHGMAVRHYIADPEGWRQHILKAIDAKRFNRDTRENGANTSRQDPDSHSVAERLRRLEELRRDNLISDVEYQERRKKILEGL
jgi:membrane protein YdbS with pleckstrin-like domain